MKSSKIFTKRQIFHAIYIYPASFTVFEVETVGKSKQNHRLDSAKFLVKNCMQSKFYAKTANHSMRADFRQKLRVETKFNGCD